MNEDDIDNPAEDEIIQNHQLIHDLINPVEHEIKETYGHVIKLKIIRKMITERHQVAHADTKTTGQQKSFILQCKAFQFPQEYPYVDHFNFFLNILSKLDHVDKSKSQLRRTVVRKK